MIDSIGLGMTFSQIFFSTDLYFLRSFLFSAASTTHSKLCGWVCSPEHWILHTGHLHLGHFGELEREIIGLKQPRHTGSGDTVLGPIIIGSSLNNISLFFMSRDAIKYLPLVSFLRIWKRKPLLTGECTVKVELF